LAKIAIAADLERALEERRRLGGSGAMQARHLAHGDGWTVDDIVCTAGPDDRTYEERHREVSVSIVVAGSFEYRAAVGSAAREALMTPGSVFLGNAGQCFACGHSHGAGDRCVSFHFSPGYFERLFADAGVRAPARFPVLRLPPARATAPFVTRACVGLLDPAATSWEELGLALAAAAIRLAHETTDGGGRTLSSRDLSRVSDVVRSIERDAGHDLTVASLAGEAGLSPYHFLRTFRRLTGVTPHQYVLRMRLRDAALRLVRQPAKVLDVALDAGFGDVSNFNHAFRAEFGVSPRRYRAAR
jgi:AraC-like DNA-binding protein